MKRLRASMVRLMGMFGGARRERELADEIDSHLQMHIDDNLRSGMTAAQARRDAILKLGGVESTAQAYRERGTIPFVENLLLDIRFAIRQVRKNPGFACTAILILALGVCASVSIFGFVDAALIRSLPYRDPSRLVALYESTPSGPRFHLAYLDYLDWKRLNTVFSSLEAFDNNNYLLNTPTGVQQSEGATVSAGFFRTLGVAPILGRDFRDGEDVSSAPRTVLLSYSAWQRRYSGSPNVLGQTVTLSGTPNIIVGVLPPQFHFAPVGSAEFWTALHRSPTEDRGGHGLSAIARLKDGISLSTAAANMESIADQLAKEYPDADQGRGATVVPLTEAIVGNLRSILLVLLAGAALLLLIACVNIASLLLVRSESRRRETALRGALGASPFRLVRQFITESLMLVVLGSALGVAGAAFLMRLLTRLIPPAMMNGMPYLQELGLNGRQFAFACGISLVAALLFSVVPILRLSLFLSPHDTREDLTEGGRSSSSTLWRNFGANLVVIELATAMVLLVGAGLLAKSFYRLLHTDIGIQPEHLATLRVVLPHSAYPKDEQIIALSRQILDGVKDLPGVNESSISHSLPIGGIGGNTTFEIVGRPTSGAPYEVNQRQVSPSYFSALQARLLRGRFFSAHEDASKPHVAIINQTMARQYFPGEDPIGKHIRYDASEPPIEIVGVVDNVKEGPLDQATRPAIYEPFDQEPDNSFFVLVRTSHTEESVIPAMAALIHKLDPGIVITEGATMTERINNSSSAYLHRSSAWLVGGFAGLALLLGAVGLYGVLAYSVSQRTREIGVRMALGAQRSSVYRLILKEAGWLIAGGILAGLVSSMVAGTLMRSLLFGVPSWDVATLATVSTVLSVSALLASYLPARRAASVDPMEALRAE
jgi:macrolide transport system ATP-binding/permease protein